MLQLHQRAKDEVREAAVWYEARSTGLGKRFVESIRQVFDSLEANPSQFSSLETLSTDVPIRRALVKGFPYVIVFEIFDKGVFVYAVAHAARRPNYWRRRKTP